MWQGVLKSAILAACLAHPLAATAATYEVTTSGQLDTLIGTASLPGTARGGDRIHISRGIYVAPTGGWKIRKPLEIFGDGAGAPFSGATFGDSSCTWLQPASGSDSVLVIDISQVPTAVGYLPNIYIHDLAIGRGVSCSANANSVGIAYKSPGGKNLTDFRLARIQVFHMGGDGIHLEGADSGTGAIVGATLDDVNSAYNCGDGLEIINATVVRILGGAYRANAKIGASIRACSAAHLIRTNFEANQTSASGSGDPQVFFESSHGFYLTGGHFEGFATSSDSRRTAVSVVNCNGGYIGNSKFSNADAVSGSRGIWIWYSAPNRSIVVGPNVWASVDKLVEIADDSTITSCVVMPQAIFATGGLASKVVVPEIADRGHVVMPATTGGSNLTAGVEFPRLSLPKRDAMTKASSGGSLREGLVVYNDSTNTLNHFDGARWRENAALFPATSSQNAPAGGIVLPAIITSSTRDSIPAPFVKKGTLFYNAEKNKLNYWDGTEWKEITVKNGSAP